MSFSRKVIIELKAVLGLLFKKNKKTMYHTLLNYSLKKVICYTAHCIIFWYILTCPKIYCHIFNSCQYKPQTSVPHTDANEYADDTPLTFLLAFELRADNTK